MQEIAFKDVKNGQNFWLNDNPAHRRYVHKKMSEDTYKSWTGSIIPAGKDDMDFPVYVDV